jgi:hypothetical protein
MGKERKNGNTEIPLSRGASNIVSSAASLGMNYESFVAEARQAAIAERRKKVGFFGESAKQLNALKVQVQRVRAGIDKAR